MKCFSKAQIYEYISGKCSPSRALELDDHVSGCAACKTELANALGSSQHVYDASNQILGLDECPEYEQLSAFAESGESGNEMKSVRAHVSSCEMCAQAVDTILSVRARASLGGELTVTPGRYVPARSGLAVWKWVASGALCAALVVGVAFSLSHRGSLGTDQVALSTGTHSESSSQKTGPVPVPEKVAVVPGGGVNDVKPEDTPPTAAPVANRTSTPAVKIPKPVKIIVADGGYALVRGAGRLTLERRDGKKLNDSKIESLVAHKLKTGGVEHSGEYVVAMNTIHVRGSSSTQAAVNGPKLLSPANAVVRSVTPTFKWSKVDMAEAYRFVLTDESGRVLFEQVTKNDWIRPNMALARGELCFWQVGVRYGESDFWTNSKAVGVKILSDEGLAFVHQVERSYSSSSLAKGVAYESVGLMSDAEREYEKLQSENPRSEIAARIRSGVAIDGR